MIKLGWYKTTAHYHNRSGEGSVSFWFLAITPEAAKKKMIRSLKRRYKNFEKFEDFDISFEKSFW